MKHLILTLVLCGLAAAQALTTISDPAVSIGVGGTRFSGRACITAPRMTYGGVTYVPKPPVCIPVTGGIFPATTLVPNDAALPAGTSYQVQYLPTSGTTVLFSETWVVPSSATALKIGDVRSAVVPSPTVMFTAPQITLPLGGLIYGSAAGVGAALAGNITATQKFLCQTGTGSVSAAPAWCPAPSSATTVNGVAFPSGPSTNTVPVVTSANTVTYEQVPDAAIAAMAYAKLTGVPSTFAPSAHATSHQNGGADEVATATAAANAIPKAGAGGTLAAGWIPTLNQNTTGSAASFTGSLSGDVTGTQSATTVGKINGVSLAGLATGILKNTTTTGAPSIAVAGDFPTLNQNTTGTAATITGALALANTPLTTRADLLTVNSTPGLARLAKGTQYQTLQGGASDLLWDAVHLDQATAVTGILPLANLPTSLQGWSDNGTTISAASGRNVSMGATLLDPVLGITTPNVVTAGLLQTPQPIGFTVPFAAVSSLTILGTQTLMSTPTIACYDVSWAALSCTSTQTPNAILPQYSDIAVSFTGSQSGRVVATGVQSFLWYVDSINGSDSNAGTSPGAAFRTIAKAMQQAQVPGFNVGLAANSRWREQITLTALYGSVQAYGIGQKPLLDSSDQITAGSWTKTAGRTNVYQASVTISNGGFAIYASVWQDGVRLARAADLATCDSTPGTYFPSDETGASPIILYINATDSSSPITNGKLYEYAARGNGINTVNNATVRGIWTRRQVGFSGSMIFAQNALALDSLAEDGNIHNVFVGAGSSLYNVESKRNQYTVAGQSASQFVYYDAAPAGANVLFDTCWAHSDTAPVALSIGFHGHAAAGAWGTAYFVATKSDGFVTGYSGDNIANMNWDKAQASLCGTCYNAQNATTTATLTSSTVVNGAGIVFWATAPTVTATGVIANIVDGGGLSAFTLSGASATVSITNSSVATQLGTVAMVTDASNTVTMTLTGNRWAGARLFYNFGGSGMTLTSDNNVFSSTGPGGSTNTMVVNGTGYTSIAAYKTATSQDAASTITTRTNLNNWSGDIAYAANSITGWSKTRVTIAGGFVAPDGTLTAVKLIEDSSNNTHYLHQTITAATGSEIGALYVKTNGRSVRLDIDTSGAGGSYAYFVLTSSTCTAGTLGHGGSGSNPSATTATYIGNGWCAITMTISNTAGSRDVNIYLASADNVSSYQGDGASGIYFWHPQLNAGTAALTYQVQP